MLSLSLLCCIVVVGFLLGPNAYAMAPNLESSFLREVLYILSKAPKYVWGGIDIILGVDCSGLIFAAAKRAGIPGITRTTAYHMAMGHGGWIGVDVELADATPSDMTFWTWKDKPDRPYGHVGVLIAKGQPNPITRPVYTVVHASGSKKRVVKQNLTGVFMRDLTRVRHLTIGETKIWNKDLDKVSKPREGIYRQAINYWRGTKG